jgi:hypothetical protein
LCFAFRVVLDCEKSPTTPRNFFGGAVSQLNEHLSSPQIDPALLSSAMKVIEELEQGFSDTEKENRFSIGENTPVR